MMFSETEQYLEHAIVTFCLLFHDNFVNVSSCESGVIDICILFTGVMSNFIGCRLF